jgi:hypothetical protein
MILIVIVIFSEAVVTGKIITNITSRSMKNPIFTRDKAAEFDS